MRRGIPTDAVRGAATALLLCAGLAGAPDVAAAAGPAVETLAGAVPHVAGEALGLAWVVPFAGMLLSIALLPLLTPSFWHHHFGKVAAFWALAFLAPFAAVFGWRPALYEVLHTALLEYLPFLLLLGALFTIAGGVRVTGRLMGQPSTNTAMLLAGTLAASIMGTTGAAMLLIRPLLRANMHRRHRVHTVVFFIFLVANVGGSLTPLGDPPLFLGFLQGVPFFWPTVHLLAPMLVVSTVLLAGYYVLDSVYFRREAAVAGETAIEVEPEPLGIEGKVNILLLGGVVGAVLLSGVWRPALPPLVLFHVEVESQDLARDLLLVALALLSLWLTGPESRRRNGFTWFPIVEVAKLFAGIFATIIPAIVILRAGLDGALAPVVALVNRDGQPADAMYFWVTGLLSSVLDNAPTYLVFFNTAGGDAAELSTRLAGTLAAISCGAVFMGANTYVGNAPNFMVRAIAEASGVRMPSFFGYMAWSGLILLPLFAAVTAIFFL